jgi:hypothetical protein
MPHYDIHATFINTAGEAVFTTTVTIKREIIIGKPAWSGSCDLEPWMSLNAGAYRLDLHDELVGQSLNVYVLKIVDEDAGFLGNGDSYPTPKQP